VRHRRWGGGAVPWLAGRADGAGLRGCPGDRCARLHVHGDHGLPHVHARADRHADRAPARLDGPGAPARLAKRRGAARGGGGGMTLDLVGPRRWLFLGSAIVVVVALALLAVFRLRPGIEFTSGTTMLVRFERPVSQTDL